MNLKEIEEGDLTGVKRGKGRGNYAITLYTKKLKKHFKKYIYKLYLLYFPSQNIYIRWEGQSGWVG